MSDTRQVTVLIPGEPVAQGRPRFVRRTGHAYDPPKSRSWKERASGVMARAVPAGPGWPLLGPCHVRVLAVFSCPPSDHHRIPVSRRLHAKNPDAENVSKAVLDAGNGVLWRDDRQVCRLTVEKWIGAQGEDPFVQIDAWELY